MTPRTLPLLVLLVLLAPGTVATETHTYAPLAVVAVRVGELTAVSWAPGEVPAEAYRVYGLTNGGATLLHETTGQDEVPAAKVPSGFAAYGVTGILDGAESPLVVSAGVGADSCSRGPVTVILSPPQVLVCKQSPPPKVQLPVLGRFLP